MSNLLTDLTIEQLREKALTAPRFLSIACTRLAEAKEALALGDVRKAAQYQEAAKVAYRRSKECNEDQVKRVERTANVIEDKGMAQAGLTSEAGKHVVKVQANRAGAIWSLDWARSR